MRTSHYGEERDISTSLHLNMLQCAGIFSRRRKYSANAVEGTQVRVCKCVFPDTVVSPTWSAFHGPNFPVVVISPGG